MLRQKQSKITLIFVNFSPSNYFTRLPHQLSNWPGRLHTLRRFPLVLTSCARSDACVLLFAKIVVISVCANNNWEKVVISGQYWLLWRTYLSLIEVTLCILSASSISYNGKESATVNHWASNWTEISRYVNFRESIQNLVHSKWRRWWYQNAQREWLRFCVEEKFQVIKATCRVDSFGDFHRWEQSAHLVWRLRWWELSRALQHLHGMSVGGRIPRAWPFSKVEGRPIDCAVRWAGLAAPIEPDLPCTRRFLLDNNKVSCKGWISEMRMWCGKRRCRWAPSKRGHDSQRKIMFV